MATPLALRLEAYVRLSQDDRAALDALSRRSIVDVAPRRDIIREGDNPHSVKLVLEGWACRYKSTADGRRQIVGFFIPGDFCDLNVFVLRRMDHSIGAITRVRVAEISREQMDAVTAERPRVTQAFWWHELVNASIQREWLLNVGQRSAHERIAHLLVELFFRSRAVGLADGDACPLPITQNDIADATGLTSVHVNRTLQELRRLGLIEVEHRRLRLPDIERLMDEAGFNPDYLHLDHEGRHLDAND